MNGQLQNNNSLLHQLRLLPKAENIIIGLAAPTVYLLQLHNAMKIVLNNRIITCAQDVSRFSGNGSYTGEVSAQMMSDIGANIVLIGHSERRIYFDEDNETQREKLKNVINAGLVPLLCIGESMQQREEDRAHEVIAYQLSIIKNLEIKEIAVAYEPVWAIGTGKTASQHQITEMHEFIYNEILSLCDINVKIRVLYGGSVNASNARSIFSIPHVNGVLVGGASLNFDSFTSIIDAAK